MEPPRTAAAPWTVARLLDWTREYFRRSGLESPRLCAEILLAHAMKCERIRLYTRHEETPPADTLATFRENVRLAAEGRPIAYLIGTKEFFSLPFEVTPDVLIPRPETEILVERTIDLARRSDGRIGRILDLCTGSGCVAVALARFLKDATIVAGDVSAPALDVARRNAARHGVAERVRFVQGDLFAALGPASDGAAGAADDPPRFDVIVANPPYVASNAGDALARNVRDYEPHVALFAGGDGLEIIRRIIVEAPGWLAADGHLLVEIGYDQAAAVGRLLDAAGWRDSVFYKDGAGHARAAHARPPIAAAGDIPAAHAESQPPHEQRRAS